MPTYVVDGYEFNIPVKCLNENKPQHWLGKHYLSKKTKILSSREIAQSGDPLYPWYQLCITGGDATCTNSDISCYNNDCLHSWRWGPADPSAQIDIVNIKDISGMVVSSFKHAFFKDVILDFTYSSGSWNEISVGGPKIILEDVDVTVIGLNVNGWKYPATDSEYPTIFEMLGNSSINIIGGSFSNNSNISLIKYVNHPDQGAPKVTISGMTFSNNTNETKIGCGSVNFCINDRTLVELSGAIVASFIDCSWINNTNYHAITAKNGTSISLSGCHFSEGDNTATVLGNLPGFWESDLVYSGTEKQQGAMRAAGVYANKIDYLDVQSCTFSNIKGGSGVVFNINDANRVTIQDSSFENNTNYFGEGGIGVGTNYGFGTGVVVLSDVPSIFITSCQFIGNNTAEGLAHFHPNRDLGGSSALLVNRIEATVVSAVTITNTKFQNNSGKVLQESDSTVRVNLTDWVGGAALQLGYPLGGLYGPTTTNITGCNFSGNTSVVDLKKKSLSSSIYANLRGDSTITIEKTEITQSSDVSANISYYLNNITDAKLESMSASNPLEAYQYWMVDGSLDYATSDIRVEGNGTLKIGTGNTWTIDNTLSTYNYVYFMVLNKRSSGNQLTLDFQQNSIDISNGGFEVYGGNSNNKVPRKYTEGDHWSTFGCYASKLPAPPGSWPQPQNKSWNTVTNPRKCDAANDGFLYWMPPPSNIVEGHWEDQPWLRTRLKNLNLPTQDQQTYKLILCDSDPIGVSQKVLVSVDTIQKIDYQNQIQDLQTTKDIKPWVLAYCMQQLSQGGTDKGPVTPEAERRLTFLQHQVGAELGTSSSASVSMNTCNYTNMLTATYASFTCGAVPRGYFCGAHSASAGIAHESTDKCDDNPDTAKCCGGGVVGMGCWIQAGQGLAKGQSSAFSNACGTPNKGLFGGTMLLNTDRWGKDNPDWFAFSKNGVCCKANGDRCVIGSGSRTTDSMFGWCNGWNSKYKQSCAPNWSCDTSGIETYSCQQ